MSQLAKRTVFALVLLFSAYGMGQTKEAENWPYSPDYQPITRQEISRILRDPESREKSKTLLYRASTSGLLEHLVSECADLLKKTPGGPVLRSYYCYALFIAHDPAEYKPQDQATWKKQHDELFPGAAMQAESLVRGKGEGNPFCWRTLAYLNILGMWGGTKLGIERAKKAVALAPNDHYTHRLLAFGYLEGGPTRDLDKAMVHARRAAQLQPRQHKPYLYQAQIHFARKNYQVAFAMLKKGWALTPPNLRKGKNLEVYQMYERFAKWEKEGKV